MRQGMPVGVFLVGLLLVTSVPAELTFYGSASEWLAASENVEFFDTDSHNIGLADEIGPPPGSNSDLGSVLTFGAANTGLSRSFRLTSLNVPPELGRGLVYDDTEAGLGGPHNISIGDADGAGDPSKRSLYEDDDWQLEMLSGPDLTAFAFYLVGNDQSLAESLQVWSGTTLLGTLTDLITSGANVVRFIGLTSTDPITHIVFDEDEIDAGPDYDDIAIRDFRFGDRRETTPVESMTWAGIKSLYR